MNLQWTLFKLPFICMIALVSGCGGGGGKEGLPPDDDPSPNTAPQAFNISLRTNGTSPIIEAQLLGEDSNNDTIVYVLDSPRAGLGYSLAFVEPNTGIAHIVLDGTSSESLNFSYRVSDGFIYSESALLTIDIGSLSDGGIGANDVSPDEYGSLNIAYFEDESFGGSGGDMPSSVDLSNNFPPPGDQGRLGSCVGWAIAYALKSYQEKVEEHWEFASQSTVFSPAWIYNQINGGVDAGSNPIDALKLIVNSGAATLATMPYDDDDFTSQPSAAARAEASYYRANSFSRIGGVLDIRRSVALRTPVTIGIRAFDNLFELNGAASVYNDFSGEDQGGHMVTIVGYDDSLFGGAFKVINSWGTDWGDGGFFWLPYRSVASTVDLAFVLNDATNSGDAPSPVQPPVDETLPNLVVTDWSATYNPKAGGLGELQWEVSNIGASVARAGADINLVLSRDEYLDPSDVILVYEELPGPLESGQRYFRDDSNTLPFKFPLDLPAGNYYLALWIDDLDEVAESNETDNVSFGASAIAITEVQLPDLVIDSWWASWGDVSGYGELEYSVTNDGNVPVTEASWDINLVLSTDENVQDSFSYYLFYEGGEALAAGQTVSREEGNSAQYNIFQSLFSGPVTPGEYFMSLWVDDTGLVDESREYNNLSTDNTKVGIFPGARSNRSSSVVHRFNGKKLPIATKILGKISIENTDSSRAQVVTFTKRAKIPNITTDPYDKIARAKNPQIFPVVKKFPMPLAASNLNVDVKAIIVQ